MQLPVRGLALLSLALVSPVAFAKKEKKNKGEAPVALVGWQTQLGWPGSCYYPPDFQNLNNTDRLRAREQSLTEMMAQWNGGKDDGVSMDEEMVIEVETVLLGRPERVEEVVRENLEKCQGFMTGQVSEDAWESWVGGLRASLTVGECRQPLDYTMFDYLEIGGGWQRPLSICKDEKVRISGTVKDKYRISEKGPWINVEGDPAIPATGLELPCNVEGCFAGQLILKFEADSGWEKIYPVGAQLIFEAPEHGTISYRINDESFFDNSWFKSKGLEDHTAIEVSPAQ